MFVNPCFNYDYAHEHEQSGGQMHFRDNTSTDTKDDVRRFLLIGLDGMEPTLAEQWMTEGRLPNLARLRDRGTYLRLASTIPPATLPAWTSCVTGVNPGRHGIFDFTEMVRGQYAIRFVNGRDRRSPALWNILSALGKRVGVLGVPGAYPPEIVNGFMVSGFDSPVCTGIDRSFVYPPELYPEVREWPFADIQETDIHPGWHDRALPCLMRGIETKERIACNLLCREPWDFFMVVFGESDTVAHHFWMFHDEQSPRHRTGHEDAIRRVYERLDAAVGALMDAADGMAVGVVSDHGFGGAGTGVAHLNNWLAEQGYLALAGSDRALMKKAALSFVPDRWRGALFRRFPAMSAKAESRSRFAGIDWNRTRAWSEELNYFPSIRVNLQGREPAGQVPAEGYDAFLDELCARLETWPVVKKAWRREAVYHGPHLDHAPDILLELNLENGYSHSCLRARGGPSFRRLAPGEYLGGKERGMNGNHRPEGVFFLSIPANAGAAQILDVAPTVLALMGVPRPDMDGVSLIEAEETIQPIAPAGTDGVASGAYSPEQARQVEDRLRALGYFE